MLKVFAMISCQYLYQDTQHRISLVCDNNIYPPQRLYVRNKTDKTDNKADILLTLVYIWGSLEHRYITEDTDPMVKPMISLVVKEVIWKDTQGKATLEHTDKSYCSDFPSWHFTLVTTSDLHM